MHWMSSFCLFCFYFLQKGEKKKKEDFFQEASKISKKTQ